MAIVDIESLLAQLTLDEKLALIAGESQWRTATVERLGIPCLKVSDGPSGARDQIFGEGVPVAFFPSGVSLGATWDEELVYEIGEVLAEETKSKSASVILAPTMCIHRHPLGGRNFESFSEDPFLTDKLASAHVRGVQSRGVGATPKHFVANDQESNRFKIDAHIAPLVLREVYLLPFQMVVREADPWCMMTAYNKVNGYHCDMSKELLTDIARDEWGWQGVFMSDWGGTNSSAESINVGLDLEMPGPPEKRSKAALSSLLQKEQIDLKQVDRSALRMLRFLQRAGRFINARDDPEICLEDLSTKSLLLRAATDGIVMLKNESNALPLLPNEGIRKFGIFGPNAKRVIAGGGGSAYIKAPYWTCVFESVAEEFRDTPTEIVFATGAKVNRYLPTMPATALQNADTGAGGAAVDWYLGHDCKGNAVTTTHIGDLYYMTFGVIPEEVGRATGFSYCVRGNLKPFTSGQHKLSLASIGPATLYIHGRKIITISGSFEEKDTLFFTYGSGETIVPVELTAGQEYQIRIEYNSHDRQLQEELIDRVVPMEDKFQGVRLGYEEFDTSDLPAEAALSASDCEAAIVVVGRDKEWETEGHDIPTFELPGEQVRLIQQVAAVCKRTIVVIQAGTPVQMDPWINEVSAVLYTWYQGQELGNAAAAVLCGKANPSGRLPITFPRRIEDCPAFSSFPGEQSNVYYSEGLYVGYRWWDLLNIQPQFPIGFGLSYTTFVVSTAGPASATTILEGTILSLPVRVRNTGCSNLPGRETVIAWCSQRSPTRLVRPKKQICGFAKSPALSPGEECTVNIQVDTYALGFFDPKSRSWVIDTNTEFDILLGTTALNAAPSWRVIAPEEITWKC